MLYLQMHQKFLLAHPVFTGSKNDSCYLFFASQNIRDALNQFGQNAHRYFIDCSGMDIDTYRGMNEFPLFGSCPFFGNEF